MKYSKVVSLDLHLTDYTRIQNVRLVIATVWALLCMVIGDPRERGVCKEIPVIVVLLEAGIQLESVML